MYWGHVSHLRISTLRAKPYGEGGGKHPPIYIRQKYPNRDRVKIQNIPIKKVQIKRIELVDNGFLKIFRVWYQLELWWQPSWEQELVEEEEKEKLKIWIEKERQQTPFCWNLREMDNTSEFILSSFFFYFLFSISNFKSAPNFFIIFKWHFRFRADFSFLLIFIWNL